ncbi:DUF3999 domain-containing protein [Lysobacter silvisoli]|uniref:DUF3999 domain-containing protein n=1 Tax=Lysobacter silvisoli TaxID=2293254 RepID=A0A371JZD9_9GAMM|nr:DUF3999 domain-containing protein [Lysobacter silvisoli]RDZ26960.1 DUF3999 domain-containing protein [Lysobacter silvisoli]
MTLLRTIAALALAGLPALAASTSAVSAPRDDYAQQWPLQLVRADAGAYRVDLSDAVYQQARQSGLRDVDVLDGTGYPVPAALYRPDAGAAARTATRVSLPWFALPARAAGTAPDWELVSEVEADGRLRRVEARGIGRATATGPQTALLVDASALRSPILALELDWTPGTALDAAYRVEASDNLERWRDVAASGRLVDLQQGGRRLVQRRIAFEAGGLRARYLRLTPQNPNAVAPIRAVSAEFGTAPDLSPLRWRELNGRRVEGDGEAVRFEFQLDGRYPIQRVDVSLPGNYAVNWTLESRDSQDSPWQPRLSPWTAFRVAAGGHSASRPLSVRVDDRYWRLSAGGAVAAQPVLRLAYQPETLVFIAQGAPPYTLVAGSARAERADLPLPQTILALQAERGPNWQPAEASLGAMSVLAGTAALQPPEPERNWRTWILWAVLVAGALIVAGFAFSLLKNQTPKPQGPDSPAT